MRIERVIIKGLRALRQRDDDLVGPDGPYEAVCLRGVNGSGKTTYLSALTDLWQWFRGCTQQRRWAKDDHLLIKEADLVAMQLSGLPGPRPRMWISYGRPKALAEFQQSQADLPFDVKQDRPRWDPSVLEVWDDAFTRAENGQDQPPNMVFLEAHNRYVRRLNRQKIPAPLYQPLARYLPTARGPSHLEGLMHSLFIAWHPKWEILTRTWARLRPGIKLLDRLNESTQGPLFQLPEGTLISVHELSAGEQALLISLCLTLRWLAPGGVVLIDEPELHQHLSMMRGSLAATQTMLGADPFRGQLFVASHAPEVWDHFNLEGHIIDLDQAQA